jgi:hypothetical protein
MVTIPWELHFSSMVSDYRVLDQAVPVHNRKGCSIVEVAHAVPVVLGAFPFNLRATSWLIRAATPLAAPPSGAFLALRILASSCSGLVDGSSLHHLVPTVPGLLACQGRLHGECASRVFSKEAVDKLPQNPAL